MLGSIVLGSIVLGACTWGAIAFRRVQLRDRPVMRWGRAWPSSEAAVGALASSTGLVVHQRPPGLGWVGQLLLAPIWVFWGDLRAQRPERKLAGWFLDGTLPSTRRARITLSPDDAHVAIASTSSVLLWADATSDGLRWPIEKQEGLRALHPVGSARWLACAPLVERAFALGLDHLRLSGGELAGDVTLEGDAPGPARYAELLSTLEALASELER